MQGSLSLYSGVLKPSLLSACAAVMLEYEIVTFFVLLLSPVMWTTNNGLGNVSVIISKHNKWKIALVPRLLVQYPEKPVVIGRRCSVPRTLRHKKHFDPEKPSFGF